MKKQSLFSLFSRRNGGKSSIVREHGRSRRPSVATVEAMESRLLCASTPTAPNIPGSWNLAFNDNFSSINSKVWSNTYEWGGTQGTQATFSPSALSTSSNGLSITAKNVPSTSSPGVTNPYTSGVLTTAGTTGGADGVKPPGFTFTYGYVQTTM